MIQFMTNMVFLSFHFESSLLGESKRNYGHVHYDVMNLERGLVSGVPGDVAEDMPRLAANFPGITEKR